MSENILGRWLIFCRARMWEGTEWSLLIEPRGWQIRHGPGWFTDRATEAGEVTDLIRLLQGQELMEEREGRLNYI